MESLVLLACPVGMGLMMLFMARGMKRDQPAPADDVETLRSERARLTAEIDQLESERAARTAERTS